MKSTLWQLYLTIQKEEKDETYDYEHGLCMLDVY